MPILLDDISKSVAVTKTYSPKFFDSKLTGSGKKIGLLSVNQNPIHIPPTQTTTYENTQTKKRKITNGQTDITLIPVNIISYTGWDYMDVIPRPHNTQLTKIGHKNNSEVYIDMPVHSFVLEETANPASQGGGTKRVLNTCYQVLIYIVNDANDEKHEAISYLTNSHIPNTSKQLAKNQYYTEFTCNPLKIINDISNQLTSNCGYTMDDNAIIDFINNYCLYSATVKRSEEWQTTIDKVLDCFFENVALYHPKHNNYEVINVLRSIEDYNVPLDLYRNIYASITTHFNPDTATMLCKQNLNLLLSDTLNNLNNNKAILTKITPPNPPTPVPMNVTKFSPEQQKAITSTEPLVLVQAGAGTGKSTVILGRIDYMIASGVKPEDITVLSFTNAAADNITAKNPNIHSMTIARMIHNIYTNNYTQHELSSIDTIINSLDIYFANDETAMKFKRKLYDVAKNENNAFTALNNFIEKNFDAVMTILDTIKQTSLELEIVICYQKIDTLTEPADVASKYLIIDEVQDNSIFEFIYTLKYVDKHKESLFIVGDCSQTLYEFRASNPKALNVLEGSGVFATYQLQVNYRSNQEILDFANVALQNIEANQYAHIQLQANSLNPVTEQSFTDKVKFHYHELAKMADFNDALSSIVTLEVKPYIDAKLAAGEQVAFLGFTRQLIFKIQGILQTLYPDKTIANLVPDKMYNSTIFSSFIKNYWDKVQFIPSKSIISVISQEIIARLDYLVYDKNAALPSVQKMLANWQDESKVVIDNWQNQYMIGQMTQDEFLTCVKECMLQFEIRNNAVKQALLSARNEANKKNQNVDDANFVLSTIHSAKGLEFDNCVIIYRNENDLAEDKKRMYYVAFTRAMKSEFILAYDTTNHPKIEADYKTIVDSLHAKAPAPTLSNTPTNMPSVSSTDDNTDVSTTDTAVTSPDASQMVSYENATYTPPLDTNIVIDENTASNDEPTDSSHDE